MNIETSLNDNIISKAKSFPGIRAGITRLEDVLEGRSSHAIPDRAWVTRAFDDIPRARWLSDARSVLVLGLHHPEDTPRLDCWEGGDTWGNRRLREISETLKQWLREEHGLSAYPLPYHVEKGGLFLKDAAVLAGLGIIGRNNLLLHPEWGPRIRFRSVLLEGELEPTPIIENFSPCKTCDLRCHNACPQHAFVAGTYSRSRCQLQMYTDEAHKVLGEASDTTETSRWVIKYCRACELACPIGQ